MPSPSVVLIVMAIAALPQTATHAVSMSENATGCGSRMSGASVIRSVETEQSTDKCGVPSKTYSDPVTSPCDQLTCLIAVGAAALGIHMSFGNWSECDDDCGNGTEVQSLICDCPDGCPMGDKECAQSAKPPQPSRPCFPVGKKTGPKFCTACPLEKSKVTCTGCPRGFALQGDCEIRDRVAVVTYHAQGKNLSLADGWLASAFIPAFRDAVSQETNISVDVINFTSSGIGGDVFGSGGVDIGIVAASPDNTDESLNWTSNQLASVNMQQLASSFQNELSKYGCTPEHQCSTPAVAFNLVKKPDMMCPPPLVWSNSCRVPGTPPSHGFPGWGVALIITGALLLVAVLAWATCSRCKRAPPGQNARLLSAA